jgi:hypothetical protein
MGVFATTILAAQARGDRGIVLQPYLGPTLLISAQARLLKATRTALFSV